MAMDRNDLPIGFTMTLSQDLEAMNHFATLGETRQRELINFIRNSTSSEDARIRISSVVNKLHDNLY